MLPARKGKTGSIHTETWPTYEDALTIDDEIELVIQVNGKIVNKIAARRGLAKQEAEDIALTDIKVKDKLNGSSVKKVIVVPDKLVNVVI
jgi:leucyl-tRNA synthetase